MPVPILIGLIIAKGMTMVGPTHEYLEQVDPDFPEEEAFPTFLDELIKPYTLQTRHLQVDNPVGALQRLQLQVDNSADLFVQTHTMLVLLQGATLDFAESTSDLYKPRHSITVNAYLNDESKYIDKRSIGQPDEDDGKWVISPYKDTGDCLKTYLDIASKLPYDFEISKCLEACQQTIKGLNTSTKRTCMTELSTLVHFQFSEVDIDEALVWARDHERQASSSDEWLTKQLSLGNLWQDVSDYYASPNAIASVKLTLSRIYVMLQKSHWFYNQIRYEHPHDSQLSNNRLGQDLEEAINKRPSAHKGPWEELRLALHGAIAWYIYRLCASAVDEVQAVIRR